MNKTVQDLKMKIGVIEKTLTESIQEMKNLGIRTGTAKARFTNRI